ncbi:MAG: hypothetical protein WD738_21355 [Pirellulales bacterium]
MSAADIFNSLTPAEKRKALAILSKADQSPCDRLGHNMKPIKVQEGFWAMKTVLVCTRCGKQIVMR